MAITPFLFAVNPATASSILRIYLNALASGQVTIGQLLGNFLTAPYAFQGVPFLSYTPTFGTNQDDQIDRSSGDNLIWGLDGNDTITTAGGNDILDGGNGDDALVVGIGRDLVFGGNGDDFILANGTGFLFGGSGNDVILGANDASFSEVSGGAGDDTIEIGQPVGSQLTDKVRGDDGNDVIQATNVKRIVGGRGNDSIFGFAGTLTGSSNQQVVVTGDGGDDTIRYALNFAPRGSSLSGGQGNDILSGNGSINGDEGNDQITIEANFSNPDNPSIASGGSGDDLLIGAVTGDKSLLGGDGDDILSGSPDRFTFNPTAIDTMTGGAGRDRFVLGDQSSVFYIDSDPNTANDDSLSNGFAIITDFTIGQDVIQLKGSPSDYRLDLFSGSGVSRAVVFYTQGQNVPERMAILGDAPSGLSLTSPSFSYV
ncbi:MAG: calcium-binding protein [Elainella sp.]